MSVIDLESAAREVVRLLDGVTEDRLDDPTPDRLEGDDRS
jgi:hypothetical protein